MQDGLVSIWLREDSTDRFLRVTGFDPTTSIVTLDPATPLPGEDSDDVTMEQWEQGVHDLIAQVRQRQEDAHHG